METDMTVGSIELKDARMGGSGWTSGDGEPHRGFPSLTLLLEIADPQVVRVLERHRDQVERTAYAQTALRIGVLALEQANGAVDAVAVRDAGQQLIADVREILTSRARDLSGEIAGTLKQYFDPATGVVHERLRALVRKDGDLDRLLLTQVGADDSVVAKTLAQHLGADSQIFRMLSPTQADGLKMQIEHTLAEALVARIAFESKADKAYDVASALGYLDEAKKNRQAQTNMKPWHSEAEWL